MPDVCIVAMPYYMLNLPSIGIGQLVSAAKQRGIDAQAVYANLWFAEKVGLYKHNIMCQLLNPASLLAEWTFSSAAFPDFRAADDEYISLAVSCYHEEALIDLINKYSGHNQIDEFLYDIREKARDFINEAADRILAMKPKIVGCSSIFQQHCASLALLRRLKQTAPEIITLMGGANCEGIMGQTTLRCFPWVDFIMSGECDLNFPDFCENVLAKGTGVTQQEMPYGVISREYLRTVRDNDLTAPVALVDNIDSVPIPDYTDYFEELKRYANKEDLVPGLVMETSRGCWWGQKNKCSFCGLNGNNAKFRTKSTDRVIDEIKMLSGKYGLHRFSFSDNIMDMKHFQELLPRISGTISEQQDDYSHDPKPIKNTYFFETKSNLNEEQVIALKRAGIIKIQPGIESLHDGALKLMNKGNSAIGNLALLKFTLENGIQVSWNYLIGIPAENDEWNHTTAEWLPLIYHFEPPQSIGNIRFDRYSTYYNHPERYGLELSPHKTYSYIYPLDNSSMANMVCYFEDYKNEDRGQGSGAQRLKACFDEWNKSWYRHLSDIRPDLLKREDGPQLIMREAEDITIITDTRNCAVKNLHFLEGLDRKVHDFCRKPRLLMQLLANVNLNYGIKINQLELDSILKRLEECKLVLTLDGRVISLATRETAYNRNRNKKVLPSFEWAKDL